MIGYSVYWNHDCGILNPSVEIETLPSDYECDGEVPTELHVPQMINLVPPSGMGTLFSLLPVVLRYRRKLRT